VFCTYLRTNGNLCHLQHKLIGFYNRDEKCLLRGMKGVFKYSILRFVFKMLRDSRVLFYPFLVDKLYPCSFVIYQCCEFYSIKKFTTHSEGKNYRLCGEENRSFISLGERKLAVPLLDPLYHFMINVHNMMPYSVL